MTANNAPPRAAIPGLTFGYRSETGPHRQINEDFVGYFVPGDQDPRRKQGAIFAVADGMGGHLAGEVASRQAVEGVIRAYYTAAATPGPAPGDDAGPALVRAFEQTNHALHTLAQSDPRRSNMGTTLVAAIIREGKLSIANVGDSRAYLLRGGRLTQITRDHSLIGEQVQGRVLSQAQARKHPYRHIITRALGTHSTVQVDLFEGEWQAGDSLLLCTDGLSGTLSARRMARLLRRAPSPQQAADQLVSQAEAQGSRDNISALVVRDGQFRPGGGYSPYLLAGLMGLLGLCLLGVALLALLISGLGLSGNPVAAPQMAPI
ncbi:MAG TPA: Stp1/IreP family PP2C-type Ser/Thr phosphatase, partial [Anaerolineae bacterium]|nr:Stp1/IreP family PP2C-type Ser/Thr phosphatase [Anaerolineae bacterium]